MPHLIVDTNVILRFLTNDIPSQANQVKTWLQKAESGSITLEILPITLIEIVFHLQNWYKLDKPEITHILTTFVQPKWIQVTNKPALIEALHLLPHHTIDFVDLLTYTHAKTKSAKILSFDQDFHKLSPTLHQQP